MTKRPKRHPEEYTDTDPRAMEVWLELLRKKTPGERVDTAFGLTQLVIEMTQTGVRTRFPKADEREVRLRAAALRLPAELMEAAYGWHSGNDGNAR